MGFLQRLVTKVKSENVHIELQFLYAHSLLSNYLENINIMEKVDWI